MALIIFFFIFNESKTKVIVLRPSGFRVWAASLLDLGPLQPYGTPLE